jgi:hypothetical protein
VCEWRAETTEIKHRQFEVKRKEKPIEETTREKEPQQTLFSDFRCFNLG